VPGLAERAADAVEVFNRKLEEHKRYTREYGEDMPEITQWGWSYDTAARTGD